MRRKWTSTRKKQTAKEVSATLRTAALADCQRGNHTHTPTFRPGETMCTVCGLVLYCPTCLTQHNLRVPANMLAFPRDCALHQPNEVQV